MVKCKYVGINGVCMASEKSSCVDDNGFCNPSCQDDICEFYEVALPNDKL